MKTKLGYIKINQEYYPDTCVVCGNNFDNPGKLAERPMFCHKKCSEVYRSDVRKWEKIYSEQFKKRGK